MRPEYVGAGYDEAKARYGSFDRCLQGALAVDSREPKQLQEDLLVG